MRISVKDKARPNLRVVKSVSRIQRTTKTTPPTYINKLVGKLGYPKAADAIGMTGGALRHYIRDDAATIPAELAAQLVYNRDFGVKKDDAAKTALITGDAKFIQAVKGLAEYGNNTFTLVNG